MGGPYYPVHDARNEALCIKYAEKALAEDKVICAGRPETYKYYDMDKFLVATPGLIDELLGENK